MADREVRHSEPAREIGAYKVVRLLGKGGMSEVYEVEDPRLGSRRALKIFACDDADPDVRTRFEVEGRLLAKLNHPRIVRVTDFGVDGASGRPYFVMDLVLDETGATRALSEVEPGSVDEEVVGRWYDDLRAGLAYIHANGVIHRDLKLQNVLIGADGHAVLTDFGISKIFDASGTGKLIVDTVNTIAKVREGRSLVMGSIGYMAPELEMGVAASPQSDWYALGVIVYRLLTGTWCDARTDVTETLDSYDPVWKRIVPRLLHSNPNGRECLSYEDEKRTAREKAEAESESRWLKEKSRGHVARHVARYVGLLSAAFAVALLFLWQKYDHDVETLRQKAKSSSEGVRAPTFDDLFKIPAEAQNNEKTDARGTVVMPSRGQFEAARLDALVLTYETLDALRSGTVTAASAARTFESLREDLSDEATTTPFDRLSIGNGEYMQVGDNDALRILLERAAARLQEFAE